MNKFREPWPWEPGGTPMQSDPFNAPPQGEMRFEWYGGFRIVPKTRCGLHDAPIIEFASSTEGTFWKCQKCPERMPAPLKEHTR